VASSRTVAEHGTYTGTFTSEFERSVFRACARPQKDSQWWVVLGPKATLQWDSASRALKANKAFVRWVAGISDTGAVGHLGASSRYVMVDSIMDVHASGADDCKPGG
jgi:hypothetical protein